MAIFGLTVGEDGEAIQRLAVTTKVSIGQKVPTQSGKTRPDKLDHFAFLRKAAKSLEWEPDPELTKHYGVGCHEFEIVLLDDSIENVFRTELAIWSASEKKCWGDGHSATRKTAEHPEGQDWSPCGPTCPDYGKTCKPSGDLCFVLADFPRLGNICRLHTTGKRSIAQLHSSLQQIQTITGGRLAGIRCKLAMRPEKTSFFDAKSNSKKSTTIYALNLEISATDMRSMLGKMTEHAQLFEQTRKLLGDGRRVEYVVEEEPEIEKAADIHQEFYADEEATEAAKEERVPEVATPERASVPRAEIPTIPKNGGNGGNGTSHAPALVTTEQRMELLKIITGEGWSNVQAKEILKEEFGFGATKEITAEKYQAVCARFRNTAVVEPEFPDEDSL